MLGSAPLAPKEDLYIKTTFREKISLDPGQAMASHVSHILAPQSCRE